MSQAHESTYDFPNLPLNPVDAGTSILVTGPSLGGTRNLVMRLLACGQSEGLLLITTDLNGVDAVADFEAAGATYDTNRMAVIDCTQDGTEDDARNVHTVSAPSDLTGIGIAFSSLYERLYKSGVEHVRTGLYTLAPLLMYAQEVQPLYRFLHTVTGRIRTAEGLGVATLDPQAHDETTVRTLSQPFDGEVQLREEDGTTELRVRGLADQPDGWHALDL